MTTELWTSSQPVARLRASRSRVSYMTVRLPSGPAVLTE